MNKKEIFILSLTIFLTVIAWTVSEIIHVSTKSDNQELKSLQVIKSYKLEKNIFDIIESKVP